ncbi:MAG: hypothetical protein AB1805_12685 [Nitrospirota bacterium]
MISKQKNAERSERRQQKIDAGLMSARYPNVASIVISMNYYQKDIGHAIMQRTVNFFPGSAAYFLMECMRNDCIDGGFDLEPVIHTMVKGRKRSGRGELVCNGNDSAGHAKIDYSVAIEYFEKSR